jgi:hypothetical protein
VPRQPGETRSPGDGFLRPSSGLPDAVVPGIYRAAMSDPATETKVDRALEDRMLAAAGDPQRVAVLERARAFKRTWIELAEALAGVVERGSWRRWGYDSFDAYARHELALSPSTAAKLLGSFRFLASSAPKVIERVRHEPSAPVPSLKAVDFVARATERGAADKGTLSEIRRAAFEEGIEAPMLTKRFKAVAFPVDHDGNAERLKAQITSAAKRLAALLAEADAPVPRGLAVRIEEALGELLATVDDGAN